MRTKIMISSVAVLLGLSGMAHAEGLYVSGSVGAVVPHKSDFEFGATSGVSGLQYKGSYKTGYGANLAMGYGFSKVRVEGEFGYKMYDMKDLSYGGNTTSLNSDLKVSTFMLNGYYDFKNRTRVTPYVGLGAGVVHTVLDAGQTDFLTSTKEVSDTGFGYQGIVGLGVAITQSVTLDLSYRYQAAVGDVKTSAASFDYSSSNLMAGIRYTF